MKRLFNNSNRFFVCIFLILASCSFGYSSDIVFYPDYVNLCTWENETYVCQDITYPEMLIEIAEHWLEPPIYYGVSSGYDYYVFNELSKNWNPGESMMAVVPEELTEEQDDADLELFLRQVQAEIPEDEMEEFVEFLNNWKD